MDSTKKIVEVVTLDALAGRLSVTDPDVRRFVDLALGEVRRLSNTLAFTEHLNRQLEARAAESGALVMRLSSLSEEQAEKLSMLEAQLSRIRALCELADWSMSTTGVPSNPALLVDDVRRALKDAIGT